MWFYSYDYTVELPYNRVGQTAALKLCMGLFDLSEKLYICFLYFISIAKCRNIVKHCKTLL